MTRPVPERRRLARVASAVVFVLPLVLAATAIPDAQVAPRAPASGAALTDSLPSALDARIQLRRVRNQNGVLRFEIELWPGTSRADAEAIADFYANGDTAGSLRVNGDGFRIERSTLRPNAFPPPPPPPPPAEAPPPPPPPAPEPPPPPPSAPGPPPPPPPPDSGDVGIFYRTDGRSLLRDTVDVRRVEREAARVRREAASVRREAHVVGRAAAQVRREAQAMQRELAQVRREAHAVQREAAQVRREARLLDTGVPADVD